MVRWLVVISVVVSSCVKVQKPQELPKYNIFGILQYGVDTQRVFVDYVYEPGDSILSGIPNLVVKVSNSDTTVNFEETDNDSLIVYIAKPEGWLYPKGSYTLTVEVSPGTTITARTRVPGDFEIVFPTENDTVDTNTPLIWRASEMARFYLISLHPEDTALSEGVPFYIPLLTQDTVLPRFVYPFYFREPGDYSVRVEAIDTSYFDYLSYQRGNIENALGVFGSGVIREIKVHYSGER